MKRDAQPVVAFANSTEPRDLPDSVRTLYVPSKDNWNDFGLKVRADVGLRDKGGEFEWVQGFLALKDRSDSRQALASVLPDSRRSFVAANEVRIPFVTLLGDSKAYLALARAFTPRVVRQIVAEANDAAFLHSQGVDVPGWKNFEQSDVFNRAFMRGSDAAFAYEHGAKILADRSMGANDARSSFTAVIEAPNLEFAFKFDKGRVSENRLAVLIGKNGAGKTRSLLAVGRALIDRRSGAALLEPKPTFAQLLVFAHSRSLRRFRVTSRHPRFATQQTYALDPTKPADANVELTSLVAAMVRGSDYMDNPLQRLNGVLRAEMPDLRLMVPVAPERGWARMETEDGPVAELESFLTRPGGEQRRLDDVGFIDTSRPLAFRSKNGVFQRLSLGQDVFVTFAIRAVGKSAPASIFLIDEPENFLHPNLISQFVRLLNSVLESTRSIAIVATHSPFVVREVGRSQVFVLTRDQDALVTIQQPRLQTLGAEIGAISDDIFGDDLPDHLYLRLLRSVDQPTIAKAIEGLKHELSLDAFMRLRSMIEGVDA